ncbi:MAG: AMP-binding protein [Acidobacteriota bacterium]
MNVVELFDRAASRVPAKPALIAGKSITFSELQSRSRRIASGLRDTGIEPGDRVIVMVPMSTELYAVLMGVLRLGAVAVFVDPWIGARQLAAFSAYAEPKAWIGTPKSHALRLFDRRLRRLPVTVTTGAAWTAKHSLARLAASNGEIATWSASVDDPALITFTSGSSGTPKGADRTHGFLAAQHRVLSRTFPLIDDDVELTTFPVFALNNLALGITTVVPTIDLRRVHRADGEALRDQIETHGVTTVTTSPSVVDRLAACSLPPRLRRLLTGGAPVSDAQLRRWQRAFPEAEIVIAYGSTEAEPVAHITAEQRLEQTGQGTCAGRLAPEIDARLIPIHESVDTDLLPGERYIGELVVAGEHVCRGYFRNPEAVAKNKIVDEDGRIWHRLGDTGYFDDDGRFWLVGRVHSTVVRDGELLHAQLIEQAAKNNDPHIRRAALVGMQDSLLDERAVVVIERTVDGPRDASLAVGVAARLDTAGFPFDRIVVTRRELPLDPRHRSKIDYRQLRSRLMGGFGRGLTPCDIQRARERRVPALRVFRSLGKAS